MKKSVLREYARLIAVKGLNVQKGQDVWITCSLDQPEFIRMVTEECYRCGAKEVRVDWTDQGLTKIHYRYGKVKDMGVFKAWQEEKLKYQAENIPCRLFIESDDPDGLKGVNQKKMADVRKSLYPVIKKYRDQWENKDQWCIAAVPGEKWAKKLFPELSKKQAVEKLWEAILAVSRVTEDSVASWNEHNEDLKKRCAYLNSLGLEKLIYKASNGTDFSVSLIEKGRFCAGADRSLQGILFNPNIPTEECFTSPMKGKAEGIVYATKPLSYQGELIENFWIRFEGGKAVEWDAEKNADLLTKMITMDEGSAYLGECALVPFNSPINNCGILFYNTLFDENACCHLALGAGFEDCIEGFEDLSLEQCRELGINDSMIHEDFMIGTADLSIKGQCRDGRTVEIFKDGNWAF